MSFSIYIGLLRTRNEAELKQKEWLRLNLNQSMDHFGVDVLSRHLGWWTSDLEGID